MTKLAIACAALLVLGAGCGGGNDGDPDAGRDGTDAGPRADVGPPNDAGFTDTGMPVGTPDCTTYCELVTRNCGDANTQYLDVATCMSVCARIPLGATGAMSGNSIACRTFFAGQAETNPGTFCAPAGPAGANACGSNCASFCAIALAACTGSNAAFADMEDCIDQCSLFPTSPPYSPSVTNGDSYACRLYHLTAATIDPAAHCSHVDEGSPVCN